MVTFRSVVSLIGAVIVFIDIGSLYTFGTLTPYIASYLSYHKNPDVQLVDVNIINPVSYLLMPIGMILGSYLGTKINIRLIILVAFLMYGLVLLALSYTDNLIGWILWYGIGVGFSQGLSYMLPMNNAYKYFPKKKGLISGICMAGLGFGALIFNQLIFKLINPNNEKADENHHFPKEVADNLPYTLKILALVYFGIAIIGTILVVPYKQQKQPKIQLPETESEQALLDFNNDCPNLKVALKSQMFYRLLVVIILSSAFGIYIAFNYKEYGMYAINDDSFLTLAGSFGAIANGVSRFVWGALFDVVPFKLLLSLINLVLLGLAVSFSFVVHIKAWFMVYLLVIYFSYGGLYAVFPSITYKIFGQKHGAEVYSLLFFGYSIGSIVQFISHYYFVKAYGADGNKYSFWIFAGCSGVGILIVIFSRWRVDWKEVEVKRQSLLTSDVEAGY